MLPRAARQFTDRIRPPIGCASHHRLDRGGGSARSERISDLVDVFRNARAALTSTRRPRALGVARRPRVVRRATEMSFAVWGCAPARHRAFFAGASVPRVSRARSGTWTPRGRRPRLGAVAILRPDLPQPPREPTWQDRLENLKEYGENDGPLGRKNRGPRRRIRRTVSKPRIAPNSVDDKIRAWNESRGVSPPSEPSPASTSSNAIPASATAAPPSIAQGPFQREEIRTYSFLGQSEVRYPAASLRDPASRATYADSDVDKIAIAVSAKQLAEAAGVEVTTLGDPSKYDTLARAAKALRDSRGPGALRETVSELMRGQIRAGVPPLPGLSGMMQTLIPPEMIREMNATVASEAAEWMFGPTTREAMAGRAPRRHRRQRQKVPIPRGDGVRGRLRQHVQAPRARRHGVRVRRSRVHGAQLRDGRMSYVLRAGTAAGERRPGDARAVLGAVRRRGAILAETADGGGRDGSGRVPSGERVDRAGDAGAGVGQVWGVAGEGARVTSVV